MYPKRGWGEDYTKVISTTKLLSGKFLGDTAKKIGEKPLLQRIDTLFILYSVLYIITDNIGNWGGILLRII